MAKFQVTPIIGLPQFNGWSQVTTNSRHSLICSLAIFGQNAGNIGRDMVGILDAADPRSAAELHTLLQSIIDDALQVRAQPVLACLLATNQHTILATYQGSVLLKRNGKVGIILSSQDQLKVLEGSYVPDDTLVLATAQGSSYLGEIQQKINQGYDIDTIITSLVPAIHSSPNSSLTSLGFVTLGAWEPEPAPEIKLEPVESQPAIKLPELEITLETLTGDVDLETEALPEKKTESDTAPVSTEDLAIESDQETEVATSVTTSAPDAVLEPVSKQAPINIMWTRSSKTRSLISVGDLLRRVGSKLKPVIIQASSEARNRLQTFNWSSLNPINIWQRLSQKDVYVTRQSRQQLLKIVIPVLVIAILMVGGILFWRSRQAQQVQAARSAAAPVVEKFNQAKNQINDNPVSARQQMEESIAELEKLTQDFSNQPAARQALEQVLATTQAEFTELSGREELSSLPIFYDLNTVEAAWIANQIEADSSRLALVDEGKKQVALLEIGTKNVTLVPPLEPQPMDMSLTPERMYVLGQGIWSAEVGVSEPVFVRDIEEGDSNRDGTLLGTFGPYVYVVNPVKRNIFRYTRNEDGFSEPIGWLKPGQRFTYDNLSSMSIDGDIWLGTNDGKIHKLSMGEVADFQIKGLPEAFSSTLIVFTKENLQYLYILEPASRRLVVLQKTGEFIRQIKSGSLAAATSLAVSEADEQAFVTSGSLIFEVAL